MLSNVKFFNELISAKWNANFSHLKGITSFLNQNVNFWKYFSKFNQFKSVKIINGGVRGEQRVFKGELMSYVPIYIVNF